MYTNQSDEVDRLFARLESVPPAPDFTANVMARVRRERVRRAMLFRVWLAVDVFAAALLAWAAFSAGQVLATLPVQDGIGELIFDFDLFSSAPAEWLLAVFEVTPFLSLGILFVSAIVVALSTRAALLQSNASNAAA